MSLFISPHIRRLIDLSLDEDQIGADFTSAAFFAESSNKAYFIAKSDLVVASLDIIPAVFHRVDPALHFEPLCKDGDVIKKGTILARAHGPTISLLRAERSALNFFQRACGIATKTHTFVKTLDNSSIRIADTRKTLPGYRELDKYAVSCGQGFNHRFALSGGIMLKDNHIAAAGGIRAALEAATASASHMLKIEIEVDTLDQLAQVLEVGGADVVLLDNMSTPDLARAVEMVGGRLVTEASGNMRRERVAEVCATGVDYVSSGALTHSARTLDLGLDF